MAKELNFKPLNSWDIQLLFRFVNQFDPYSDFNLFSLLSWDTDKTNEVSFDGESMYLRLKEYNANHHIFSVLTNASDKTMVVCDFIRKIEDTNTLGQLKMVPECVVKELQKETFVCDEDRDNFDYIYDLSLLSNQDGKDYRKLRENINRFRNNYGSICESMHVQDITKSMKKDIMCLFDKWQTFHNKQDEEVADERIALSKALDLFRDFNMYITVVLHKHQIIGFTINEGLPNKTVISHFAKADLNYKNIFQFMNKMTFDFFYKNGYKFINLEQDLGIEALRVSKMHYLPSDFLKKYTVRLR